MGRDKIIEYYETTKPGYERWWHPETFHFGFGSHFQRSTTRIEQSNEYYANQIAASEEDILVIGCGKGALASLLDERTAGLVVGLDITDSLVQDAVGRVPALRGDYHTLPFEEDSFDIIVGVETVCHSNNRPAVFSESSRVLRDGGQLFISDGFVAKRGLSFIEEKLIDIVVDAWTLFEWAHIDDFQADLRKEGFTIEESTSHHPDVHASVDRQFLLGILGTVIGLVPDFIYDLEGGEEITDQGMMISLMILVRLNTVVHAHIIASN